MYFTKNIQGYAKVMYLNVESFQQNPDKKADILPVRNCLSTASIGTVLKTNKDKTMLFIQKNATDIIVLLYRKQTEQSKYLKINGEILLTTKN